MLSHFQWPLFGAVCLWLLSGLLNMAFMARSPEEWVTFAEKHPWGSAMARIVQGFGFDPIELMAGLKALSAAMFKSQTIKLMDAPPPPVVRAMPPPLSRDTPTTVIPPVPPSEDVSVTFIKDDKNV